VSYPGHTLPPGKGLPITNWIGGWMGLRAGLDAEARTKVSFSCMGLNPSHPVYSQSLHTVYCANLTLLQCLNQKGGPVPDMKCAWKK
jgi:hypothetical protein